MTNLSKLAILSIALTLAGCKSKSTVTTIKRTEVAPAPVANAGSIAGTIRFTGTPPPRVEIDMSMDPACEMLAPKNDSEQYIVANGKLANVYVYVKAGAPPSKAPANAAPVVLDQKGCRYTPHVIALQQGGSVEFRNSDPTMHNVHTTPASGEPSIDVSQGPMGAPQTRQFQQPETMLPVRCNNHPWMNAFINVSATPFFAVSAADGSFTITGVTAGDYYVSATMSGYISQQAVARMTQQPIARVPMTHIDAGRTADVVVTMDRGAVVSGRVTYDDGSAVPGVSVRLRPLTTSTTGSMGNGGGQFGGGFGGFIAYGGDMGFGETDDRGIYRLTGIAPGKYSLVVTVQTETTGQGRASGRGGFRGPPPMLNVYAPGTMRKADAQIVEIHGGETADGVDIRVALNGLHTVQGSVESKADGHMLNSGSVSLTDATDSSTTRSTVIDADGTFRMEYLPPGTYNVTVSGMDRPPNTGRGGNRGPTIRYTAASQTVTLGDSDLTMDPVQATVAASSTSTSQ